MAVPIAISIAIVGMSASVCYRIISAHKAELFTEWKGLRVKVVLKGSVIVFGFVKKDDDAVLSKEAQGVKKRLANVMVKLRAKDAAQAASVDPFSEVRSRRTNAIPLTRDDVEEVVRKVVEKKATTHDGGEVPESRATEANVPDAQQFDESDITVGYQLNDDAFDCLMDIVLQARLHVEDDGTKSIMGATITTITKVEDINRSIENLSRKVDGIAFSVGAGLLPIQPYLSSTSEFGGNNFGSMFSPDISTRFRAPWGSKSRPMIDYQ
eukprot:ANDGO_04851.mRNA.1 hypothetical protein